MNPDIHLYLYAKGWYQRTDVVEDVKKIICERNALAICRGDDLVQTLIGVVWPIIQTNQSKFEQFTRGILGYGPDRAIEIFTLEALRLLAVQRVGIQELGLPDPNILPLSKT